MTVFKRFKWILGQSFYSTYTIYIAYVTDWVPDPNSLMAKVWILSRSYGILSGMHHVWVLWISMGNKGKQSSQTGHPHFIHKLLVPKMNYIKAVIYKKWESSKIQLNLRSIKSNLGIHLQLYYCFKCQQFLVMSSWHQCHLLQAGHGQLKCHYIATYHILTFLHILTGPGF